MSMKTSKPKTTTTRKTSVTSRKPAATSSNSSATSTKAASNNVSAAVVAQEIPADGLQELRKVELLEKVVARSQVKKKDAKPVLEAVMAILGETLAEGRPINLQPMGKIMTQRAKETPTARISTVRVRQSKRVMEQQDDKAVTGKEGVAEPVK